MGKRILFLTFFIIYLFQGINSFAQQSLSFSELIEQGFHEYQKKNYDKAMLYFELAHDLDPKSPKPKRYLTLIASKIKPKTKVLPPEVKNIQKNTASTFSQTNPKISNTSLLNKSSLSDSSTTSKSSPKTFKSQDQNAFLADKPLILSTELKEKNPSLNFSVTIHKKLIIESQNIKNFLIVKPDVFDVKRINSRQIELTTLRLGTSLLYVWDDAGRWTLNFQVILPSEISLQINQVQKPEALVTYSKNFKFGYTNSWSTGYRGDSLSHLRKGSSNFLQTYTLLGQIPYGIVDGFETYTKFPDKIVLTGYGVGISNVNNFLLKSFSLRAFDTSATFSPLSLPGASFRGISAQGKTFKNKLSYLVINGQDRYTYGLTASSSSTLQRSYLEGFKLTLFPEGSDQFSFNYIHGFGQARDIDSPKKVYSINTQHSHKYLNFNSEVAFDEKRTATQLSANSNFNSSSLSASFRDIDSNFQTISGRPGSQGEIGSTWNYDYQNSFFSYLSFLDFYRSRNPDISPFPDKYNYSLSNSASFLLPQKINLRLGGDYSFTPAFLTPTRNFRFNLGLSKVFDILNKNISSSFNYGFDKSKHISAGEQNYKRNSFGTSFQIPIFDKLNYRISNSYSIVTRESTGETSYPFYTLMGLAYTNDITKKLSNSLNINYRKEGKSSGELSYLSGEDSYDCDYSLDFHANDDTSIYFSTHYRSVWAKTRAQQSYNEIGISFGLQSSWNLPLRWDYKGIILGKVFKDLNHNNKFDDGEPGIPNIKIHIGNDKYLTDAKGRYFARIYAQKVTLSLDFDDIPKGYTLGTANIKKIDIIKEPTTIMNFPLSTQSTISGIVFIDKNNNGKIDADEETLPNIKLMLDNKYLATTDNSGNYFFGSVSPGKHNFRVDVNSIPKEYSPVGKVRQEIALPESGSITINVPLKASK